MKNVYNTLLYSASMSAFAILINACMVVSILLSKFHILEFSISWVCIGGLVTAIALIILHYFSDEGYISDFAANTGRSLIIIAFCILLLSEIGWLYQLIFQWHTPLL